MEDNDYKTNLIIFLLVLSFVISMEDTKLTIRTNFKYYNNIEMQ